MELDPKELFQLLKLQIDEEHYFISEHQKRISFYTSIVTVILAATVAGAINASEPFHYLLLQVGPVLAFSVSVIAKEGTFRIYQRVLESITCRAKLEQELRLTVSRDAPGQDTLWPKESFVPPRHMESRLASRSSSDFIKEHSRLGYQRSTRRLLGVFQFISVTFSIGLFVTWCQGG